MNVVFIILGFVFAVIGLGLLLLAIFIQIPLAKKISETHQVVIPQRIDRKLDLWYGPTPYGRILIAPITYFSFFLIICFCVYSFLPNYGGYFGIGVLIGLIYSIIAFYDPKNRHKKDFNLMFGDNWLSNNLTDGTLQDEQKLKNLPEEIKEIRKFLLSNHGKHSQTKDLLQAISVLNKYDKPTKTKLERWGREFEDTEYKKVLLNYTVCKDEEEMIYHFYSDVDL